MLEFMHKHSGSGEAQDESEAESRRTGNIIGDGTPVRLGFIVALLMLCSGGFALGIWWAATISAKMDTLLSQQASVIATSNGHSKDIADLKAWKEFVDTTGTKAMMTKSAELERKLDDLSRQFELHKATTMKGAP